MAGTRRNLLHRKRRRLGGWWLVVVDLGQVLDHNVFVGVLAGTGHLRVVRDCHPSRRVDVAFTVEMVFSDRLCVVASLLDSFEDHAFTLEDELAVLTVHILTLKSVFVSRRALDGEVLLGSAFGTLARVAPGQLLDLLCVLLLVCDDLHRHLHARVRAQTSTVVVAAPSVLVLRLSRTLGLLLLLLGGASSVVLDLSVVLVDVGFLVIVDDVFQLELFVINLPDRL